MVVGIAIAVLGPDQACPVSCCDCGSASPDPGAAPGSTSILSHSKHFFTGLTARITDCMTVILIHPVCLSLKVNVLEGNTLCKCT